MRGNDDAVESTAVADARPPAVLRPKNKQDRANDNDSYPSRTPSSNAPAVATAADQQDMPRGKRPRVSDPELPKVKQEFVDTPRVVVTNMWKS